MADADSNGKPTAKSLAIAESGHPVFLLKGFEHLAGRAVRTAFDGSIELGPHARSSLHLGNHKTDFEVRASGKTDEFPHGEKVPIFQIWIMQGETARPLPLVVTNYNQVRLIWAGDLDGDNKLDLLFEDSGDNWSSRRLFLSSAAQPGELLAEVGQFYTTGC